MEYIEGIPIDQIQTLEAMGYDMTEIGEKLADNYCKQIFDDAFFHADPHPGNIWIRDGKIVWLDFGMMGRLTARDKSLVPPGHRGAGEPGCLRAEKRNFNPRRGQGQGQPYQAVYRFR